MAEKRSTETREQSQQLQRGSSRSSESGRYIARRDPFDLFEAGPFAMMRRFQDDVDRLFGGFGQGWGGSFAERERADWRPATEVFQRGTELVVRAEVPGLSRDDLTVEVGEDALTIRGERKYDHEEEREGFYRSERSYGSFCRVIPLPEGAMTENAKANFKDGVLEVVIPAPSQEVRRGRKIEIGEGSSRPEGGKQSEERDRR